MRTGQSKRKHRKNEGAFGWLRSGRGLRICALAMASAKARADPRPLNATAPWPAASAKAARQSCACTVSTACPRSITRQHCVTEVRARRRLQAARSQTVRIFDSQTTKDRRPASAVSALPESVASVKSLNASTLRNLRFNARRLTSAWASPPPWENRWWVYPQSSLP
jgi:hypothetical protein